MFRSIVIIVCILQCCAVVADGVGAANVVGYVQSDHRHGIHVNTLRDVTGEEAKLGRIVNSPWHTTFCCTPPYRPRQLLQYIGETGASHCVGEAPTKRGKACRLRSVRASRTVVGVIGRQWFVTRPDIAGKWPRRSSARAPTKRGRGQRREARRRQNGGRGLRREARRLGYGRGPRLATPRFATTLCRMLYEAISPASTIAIHWRDRGEPLRRRISTGDSRREAVARVVRRRNGGGASVALWPAAGTSSLRGIVRVKMSPSSKIGSALE